MTDYPMLEDKLATLRHAIEGGVKADTMQAMKLMELVEEVGDLFKREIADAAAPAADAGSRESFRLALREYGSECNASINASKMDSARDRVLELYDLASQAATGQPVVQGDPEEPQGDLEEVQDDPEEPLTCDYCGAMTDDPWHTSDATRKHLHQCDACHAGPAAGEQTIERTTPFSNCQFRECDLPGQCRSEGKCHHPVKRAASGQKLTDEQREALKHLVARGSSFPDHNGASGSVSRVDYRHLQEAAKVLSNLLRASDSATASDRAGRGAA